jgi:hypothetical protein
MMAVAVDMCCGNYLDFIHALDDLLHQYPVMLFGTYASSK